ncbi:MAG: polysaccharide deacetylase family protein [Alphaproteobacteria bacterium]
MKSVVADTSDFMIVRASATDTLGSLAEQYLRDRTLTPVLEDVNGSQISPGQLVILPKRAFKRSAVYTDGYQVVPILCYHQFTNGRPRNRMQVTADAFEAQMRYLIDNGYRVVSLRELEGFLNGSRPLPKRSVVVTIDDGYSSVYDIAFPILKRLGLKATLFVYTDFVGGGLSLSWDKMREMDRSGVIDIQSHSKSHTSMSPNGSERVGPAYIKRIQSEIDVPDGILSDRLGEPIRHFAYPYGDTSDEAVSLLQDENYTIAVTVQRGGNASFTHPLLLRRDMIYSDHTLQDLQKYLSVYRDVALK